MRTAGALNGLILVWLLWPADTSAQAEWHLSTSPALILDSTDGSDPALTFDGIRGAFFFDDEGSVWVMHAETRGSDPEERTVDVHDLEGAPRATTTTTLAPTPTPRVRNGLVAGVVRDELGVESVAVLRVLR